LCKNKEKYIQNEEYKRINQIQGEARSQCLL